MWGGRLCLLLVFDLPEFAPSFGFEPCSSAAVILTTQGLRGSEQHSVSEQPRINHFNELFVSSVVSWEKCVGMMRSYSVVDALKLIKNINGLFC